MATKKPDSKIMDVAKPGKTKADPTSRPVITGSGPMVIDPTLKPDASKEVHSPTMLAPASKPPSSSTKRTIMPITEGGETVAAAETEQAEPSPETTETTEVPADETPAEVAATEEATEATPEAVSLADEGDADSAGEVVNVKVNTSKIVPDEVTEDSNGFSLSGATEDAEAKAGKTDGKTTDAAKESPSEPTKENTDNAPAESEAKPNNQDSNTGGTDGGAVGALANQADAKKQADKDAVAQTARQAELDKAIAEKKYFVPIGHDSTKSGSRKGVVIALLVIIVLAVGAYLALDAGVIKINNYEVPVHLIGDK